LESATDNLLPANTYGYRFTLRALLGFFWFVASILAAAAIDVGTIFGIGIPIGLFGLLYAASNTKHLGYLSILASWGMVGVYYNYYWAYYNCPIEIPNSVTRLKVVNKGFWYYVKLVRYEAPVVDCLIMAQKMQEQCPRDPGQAEKIIFRAKGLQHLPLNMPPRPAWFDIDMIENGKYYQIRWGSQIWIDTERGIFYFLEYDGEFADWY
jgi:hypothetical protein